MIYFLLTVALLTLVTVLLAGWQWRRGRRDAVLRQLLDNIDALEGVLHQTRDRMAAMKQVVGRVAPDIGEAARASLDADQPVHQGLKHVLEHRLWVAKNVETASIDQLEQAVAALERSHRQIAERLAQLESAGAELAEATRGSVELEAREPAALRRGAARGD